MPRYKLTLEYDGSPFVGWQRQENGASVQGALEEAAHKLSGEKVTAHAAGRTDAGVHAYGMVAHIDLHKILPKGGGIGGGSSNAATALVALNYLWQTHLSDDELAEIGLALGADVPVFVRGFAAFAEGVGEKLSPAHPDEKWYLVVRPNVSIATADIFGHPDLTRNTPKRDLETLLNAPSVNDCEKIVRMLYPEVDKQLSWLLQYAPSRLTGTGSCVFAEFSSKTEAETILAQLSDKVSAFVAQGRNVSPLKETLAEYQSASHRPI